MSSGKHGTISDPGMVRIQTRTFWTITLRAILVTRIATVSPY